MYLRTTQRRNKDGSTVRYVQLAHNRRVEGVTQAQVLVSLGREDALDRDGLVRLVASINRYLGLPQAGMPADAAELVGDGLTVTESRPMGTAHLLDGLWRQLGVDTALRKVLGARRFTTDVERVLFALVASLLWPVTSVYALGYMRAHHETNQTRFYAAFAVSIGAAMGIALAGNLLTLFMFYEVLSVATYPLVTHAGTDQTRRAGRLYLGLLMGTSIGLFLLAMVWTWQLTGTLDFTPGGVFDDTVGDGVLGILLLLFVFGTGKAALMPLHRWLPAAMVAPTPVSALLHAVAVVKAGVFTILKISVYIFGLDRIAGLGMAEVLAIVAALTIVIASVIALRQDNFKARLAYSTVSQLAYITLGAMLGVAAGAIGSGLHIAMHAFGKITLFFCAGAILVTAHKANISQLNGIGRRMPWTMAAFTIGALSMIGVGLAAPAAMSTSALTAIGTSRGSNTREPSPAVVVTRRKTGV